MKQIEGLTEEDGAIYYECNGEKINLTAIGDKYGNLHRGKAVNEFQQSIGLDHKTASKIMRSMYVQTPPNRYKIAELQQKSREDNAQIKADIQMLKDIHQMKANEPIQCPRCGSTQISAVKKGFGLGKAVAGDMIAGPVGLLAGGIGSKKVQRVCLKCGHKF